MTVRTDPWPSGTPCWTDLSVPDVKSATDFYGRVMGWSFVDTGEDFGHYQIAQTRGHAAAAIGPAMQEGQPPAWTVYLASDDVEATAKLITDNGGSVVAGPMEVPDTGRMAIGVDPGGCSFGVWQANPMIGAEIVNEPGSLTWTDAQLADPEAGRAFYAAVFGYAYAPVPGAPEDYTTFARDGEIRGGMGAVMGDMPPHWLPWFSVADHEVAMAAATDGGASTVMPGQNTDFGRMGILADPFGAVFGLHSPSAGG